MSYSTPTMVRLALSPTTDGSVPPSPPSGTGADLGNDQLTDAIAEADSLIDSYIGKYYTVPVALQLANSDSDGDGAGTGMIPHPIDYWSRNIAAYNSTLTVRKSLDFSDDDPVARRYNATMAALVAVSKGQATLQIPDNTSTNSGTGAGAPVSPYYVGDLFGPEDWNLRPISPDWPLWPDIPGGFGGSW